MTKREAGWAVGVGVAALALWWWCRKRGATAAVSREVAQSKQGATMTEVAQSSALSEVMSGAPSCECVDDAPKVSKPWVLSKVSTHFRE